MTSIRVLVIVVVTALTGQLLAASLASTSGTSQGVGAAIALANGNSSNGNGGGGNGNGGGGNGNGGGGNGNGGNGNSGNGNGGCNDNGGNGNGGNGNGGNGNGGNGNSSGGNGNGNGGNGNGGNGNGNGSIEPTLFDVLARNGNDSNHNGNQDRNCNDNGNGNGNGNGGAVSGAGPVQANSVSQCFGAQQTGALFLSLPSGTATLTVVAGHAFGSQTGVTLQKVDPTTSLATPGTRLDAIVFNVNAQSGCSGAGLGQLPNDVNLGIQYTEPADKAKLRIALLQGGLWVDVPTTPDPAPANPFVSATIRTTGQYTLYQAP